MLIMVIGLPGINIVREKGATDHLSLAWTLDMVSRCQSLF
jgi:hypothetical protein